MIELVERLQVRYLPSACVERWFALDGGEPRTVCTIQCDDGDHVEQTARRWIGPIHPRVSTILAVERREDAVWMVIADERGPGFAEAAATLVDPIERERWSIAQIIGVAEACAALRARDAELVPGLAADDLFVELGGHVRLRAPLARPRLDPRTLTRTGPMPDVAWMAFLSPEQVMQRPATPATDVFVLASNLHLALTGEVAFASENPLGVLTRILQQPAPVIAARTAGLDRVLARAFEKEPAARYPDALAFAGALRGCAPDAADYDQVISDRIVAWRLVRDR